MKSERMRIGIDWQGHLRFEYKNVKIVLEKVVPCHIVDKEFIEYATNEAIRTFKKEGVEIDSETKKLLPKVLYKFFNQGLN